MPMASVGPSASLPQRLTHINTDGLFVKVSGIVDPDKADLLRERIEVYTPKLHEGIGQLRSLNELIPGKLVLVLYNNQFQRAEIVQPDNTQTRKVIVYLIDLGIVTAVDVNGIRLADDILSTVPNTGLAENFILDGVIVRKPWTSQEVDSINLWLRHCTELSLAGIVGDKKILHIMLSKNAQSKIKLSTFLVESGLAESVNNDQFTNALRAKFSKTSSIPKIPTPSNLATPQQSSIRCLNSTPMYTNETSQSSLSPTYQKTRVPKPLQSVQQSVVAVQTCYVYPTLPVDSIHNVVVSHVIDGMNAFTVQLKKSADIELPKLMAKINNIRPIPFTEQIGPGALCLGRFSQNNSICRAVVSNVLADGASLYFVDFGKTEIVSFNEIYRISPEFLQEPPMALRFTLTDLSSCHSLTTTKAHNMFARLVVQGDHGFKLKVVKSLVPTQQCCELFIVANEKAINIKNKILDKCELTRPVEYKKIILKKNEVVDVAVTFAESPSRFFILLEHNRAILDMLMKWVEDYCTNSENKDLLCNEDIVKNMAVCAPYEDDRYYRGLILDEPDADGNISVFYVDYGNTESVHHTKLCIMKNEMMSQFPTQACECRLDIDQSLFRHEKVAAMFIELADGRNFKMTVKNILPMNVLLVDLIDQNGRSLADHIKENIAVCSYASSPKASLQTSSSVNLSCDDRSRQDSNSIHQDERTAKSINYEASRKDSDGIDTTDDAFVKKPLDFRRRNKGPRPHTGKPWGHDKFNNDQGIPCDRNDGRRLFVTSTRRFNHRFRFY